MKLIGTIFIVAGLIGTLVFGIQALEDSESFSVLGTDIAISRANWTPVIVSVTILIIGGVLRGKKNN